MPISDVSKLAKTTAICELATYGKIDAIVFADRGDV
jgi:hypothetical protein